MKKVMIISILMMLIASLTFGELQQQVRTFIPIETKPNIGSATKYEEILPPDWELVPGAEPNDLILSYYDYMPGSYCSHPLRLQHAAGPQSGEGTYLIFFGRPTQTDNRRVYWAYVQSDDITVNGPGTITGYDNWQGYAGVSIIHNFSDNPVVCWHEDYDGDTYYETPVTYDDYDLLATPGFWQDVYPIENENAPTDEYIWPYVFTGPSPLGNDYVRVYILRNNYAQNSFAHPCEDVEISYKDVQNANEINTAGWEDLVTPTMFREWREYDIRPFQSFTVDPQVPGRLAFAGYAAYLTPEAVPTPPPVEEGFFVYESLDYGETWTLYDFGFSPKIYDLLDLNEDLDSLDTDAMGYHNSALFDGDGNLHWCYTGQYGYTDETGSYYYNHFIPACEMLWSGGDNVEWRNVWPKLPWEIDPDTGDTLVYMSNAIQTTINDLIFHENGMKQAINRDKDWMVQIWADGTYHQWGEDGDPDYQDYIGHPIMFMSCSKDNGEHWTEPIEISDIYSEVWPDFADQITVYPYVADEIVDVNEFHTGGDWGRVYMYYLDDNDYGSYVHQQGPFTGGDITYMAMDIDFSTIIIPTEYVTQYIPLGLEWNWISFNVHPDDTSLDSVFASVTAGNKIYQVKNQTKSATWYGVWVGNLTEITDGEGYLVNMNESVPDYSLTGMPIEVSSPIQLNAGWNWIGYYPQVQIDITPALATIQDNANQIKNQTESATWYGVWIGNLTQMKPGIGYKLLMNADDELIYPEEKGIVTTSYNSDNIMNWKIISGTQYNMVVIAKVMLNEDVITNGVLGAFDKQGNCRSVGKLEDGFWYLTIVGNTENEEISFELYDEVTGKIYNSNETVIFIDNTTIGTPDNPMSITMTGGVNSNLPTAYKLSQNYPNPFNPETKLCYQIPRTSNV